MTTAAEYRQYAQECMQSANAATSEPIRAQFLELAQLWMLAAQQMSPRNTETAAIAESKAGWANGAAHNVDQQ